MGKNQDSPESLDKVWDRDVSTQNLNRQEQAALLLLSLLIIGATIFVYQASFSAVGLIRLNSPSAFIFSIQTPFTAIVAVFIVGSIFWHGMWLHNRFAPLPTRQ